MKIEHVPLRTMFTIYLSGLILIIIGNINDLMAYLLTHSTYLFRKINGFNPIYSRMDSFYIRRMYSSISDSFNRPITGFPSKFIDLLERKFDNSRDFANLTGKKIRMLNFGSYNYLGCSRKKVVDKESIRDLPINIAGSAKCMGIHPIIRKLEIEMAGFLEKEDSMVYSMGFGTNSGTIPSFIGEGDLIISDELNHKSIVVGARLSLTTIKTYPHNNMIELENVLRSNIIQGQPKTFRPWKRIFLFTEGINSMEGTILKLQEIIKLKRKYKFYIFIDEAHSIGALGDTGRGICEYEKVDFKDIDILMGTFSKSFNGVGGYIAASKSFINFLRIKCDMSRFSEQMSPIVANEILKNLMTLKNGKDENNPKQLMENSYYMRNKLIELGYIVFGDKYSPIIPLMIFNPGKIGEFSRLCYERGLAVVVVGYPATSVIASRVRLCMSTLHSKEDIDIAIEIIDKVGKLLGMNILKKN